MLLDKRFLALFLLFVCALFMALFGVLRYAYVAAAVNLGSTRGIHTYAQKLYVEDGAALMDYVKSSAISDPFVIWKIHDDPDLLGVYGNGTDSPLPLLEGSLFQQEDFFQNRKLAIVGKNFQGATHVSLFEDTYEVVAVAGYDFATQYDSAIYYNLDSTPYGGFFYLDAEKPETIAKLLTALPQELEALQYDDPVVGITEIIDRAGNDRLIYLGFMLLLLFFAFLSCRAADWTMRDDMLVRKLIGLSHRKIVLRAAAALTLFSLGCLAVLLAALPAFGILSLPYCIQELLPVALPVTAFLFFIFAFSLSLQMGRRNAA